MKRNILIALLVVAIIALFALVILLPDDEKKKTEDTVTPSQEENTDNNLTGLHKVEIEIKDYGTIKLTLDADIAPITVTNFVNLVKEGFYDGLTLHRVIDGFMIQGGDPLGTGMGGSEKNIKGEFANNGVKNDLKHTRGVISMARNGIDMDSASSQFFIMQQDKPHLDGDYVAFGYVTEGIEIVDAICEKTPVVDSNGTVEKQYQPIITAIRVVE